MKTVTKRRSWNPYNPLTWLIILSLALRLIKGQSNTPLNSNKELEPEDQLNYGPIYFLPHAVTGSLVSDSNKVPKGYISPDGNDIGSKAENDDWRKYLASQNGLKILIPLLLLLFLAVPILGLLYACFCGRCKKSKRSSKEVRYCCGIFLAISAFLMLLFLIFAILAATQLNKSLKKTGHCQILQSSSESKSNTTSQLLRRQYVYIYNQMLRRIEGALESQPNATQSNIEGEVLARAIEQLSKVLQDLQRARPLLGELKEWLPRVTRMAIDLRKVLSGVKKSLTKFLTSDCPKKECQNFYKENNIKELDKGCLQYERLPATEAFTKSIEKVLDSNFIKYPRLAAEQLRQIPKAVEDNSNLLDTIKKDLIKGVKHLQNVTLKEKEKEQPVKTKSTPAPAAALRRKLGRSWFGFTLGMIVLFLLVPILLIVGLLVALSSPNVASWLLCCVLVALFLLFSVVLVLVLYFLVHGALTYQGFCSGQHQVSNQSIDLPKKDNLSLTELHDLKALSDNVTKDVRESLEKMESAPLLSNLSSIHPQAASAAQELLWGQLSTYKSTHFTRHMCLQLVPEPKPGPLPQLINRLDNLAQRLDTAPLLVAQTNTLRTADLRLGQPLSKLIPLLLGKLSKLDDLLFDGYKSFASYMDTLLTKIKQGDQFLSHSKKVTQNISDHVKSDLDKYFRMVDNSTKEAMLSRPTRQESRPMREYDDLCKSFAKPMNAIWFWLLLFALMLLPAICCSHYLRCRLRGARNYSQETLVSLGEENFVAANMLPLELPRCYCYKYLPVAPETNVDQLEARNYYQEDQEGVRERYRY